MIGEAEIVLSFQVWPETVSGNFTPARRSRLDLLMSTAVWLPHSRAADIRYAQVLIVRKASKRRQVVGSDASDADMWIIASALEHALPLLSHDRQQVALG
jgi:predicted nucleic acid-binding protein